MNLTEKPVELYSRIPQKNADEAFLWISLKASDTLVMEQKKC
jgi:hypothetical protein